MYLVSPHACTLKSEPGRSLTSFARMILSLVTRLLAFAQNGGQPVYKATDGTTAFDCFSHYTSDLLEIPICFLIQPMLSPTT